MIIPRITANRFYDQNFDEIRSIQATITERNFALKSNQNTSAGFAPQTTSISVILNINDTETTGSISPTEVTGLTIPASFDLIPGINTPQKVPAKIIRSNSHFYKEPNTSEKITSQDKYSGVSSHPF